MRLALAVALAALLMGGDALAQRALEPGSYICTAEQRAGVGSTHLEGAGPPQAFAHAVRYRFRLAVTREPNDRLRVVEAPIWRS